MGLSPTKAALPLPIAPAVTGPVPVCCFAALMARACGGLPRGLPRSSQVGKYSRINVDRHQPHPKTQGLLAWAAETEARGRLLSSLLSLSLLADDEACSIMAMLASNSLSASLGTWGLGLRALFVLVPGFFTHGTTFVSH